MSSESGPETECAEPAIGDTELLSGDAASAAQALSSPLAYSEQFDEPEPDVQPTWWKLTPAALVAIAAVCLVITGSVFVEQRLDGGPAPTPTPFVGGVQAGMPSQTPIDPPAPSPATDSAMWNSVLDAVPHHKTLSDVDADYVAAVYREGFDGTPPATAIDLGHTVCTLLSKGHTIPEVATAVNALTPGATIFMTARFVMVAVHSYCPEYN